MQNCYIKNSKQAYEIFNTHRRQAANTLQSLHFQEEFWIMSLSNELRVLDVQMLFRGTANSCPLHMRDIARAICLNNACSFIVAHNHPSNNPLPSRSDLLITRKIWKLSTLIEIPLTDHIILTENTYASLADRGFFHNLDRSKKQANKPSFFQQI